MTSVPDHLPNRMRSPTLTSMGMSLPVSSRAAGSNGDDLALLRLLLGGVGNVFDGIVSLDDNVVVKRQRKLIVVGPIFRIPV